MILIVADDSTDSDQKDGATLLAKVKEAKGKNSYTGLTLHWNVVSSSLKQFQCSMKFVHRDLDFDLDLGNEDTKGSKKQVNDLKLNA